MKTPNCFAVFVALFGALFTISTSASGQAVQWTQAEGGNGNWYRYFNQVDGYSYQEATDLATSLGGYLVTVTSTKENDLASSLWPANTEDRPWLGAIQDTTSPDYDEPAGGWTWVTGEPWNYTNWNPGSPNNDNNLGVPYMENAHFLNERTWVDIYETYNGETENFQVIVEWSADCNGDGIVDYGQILNGELADDDGNGVPDCCDDTSCLAPVQWKIEDGGNGNWYGVVQMSENICWEDARSYAIAQGGDLATPTTLDEDLLLKSVIQFIEPGSGTYIGGFQNLESPQYSEPLGGWEWVTGESWSYSNWHPSEPENAYGGEHYLAADFNGPVYGWFDLGGPNHPDGPCHKSALAIEWSADCNGDSMVDYGQILSGELADDNGNGVPDICELITVDDDGLDDPDADFDNIQDAVNAASDGDEILVMPGTYTGDGDSVITLPAHGITISGASSEGDSSLYVIDGEGVRRGLLGDGCGDNGTVIQGLTFTNGRAIEGAGAWLNNCSPELINCVFVSNAADIAAGLGGGLYLTGSNATLTDCQFISNTARGYGGGMLSNLDSSPTITNCLFDSNSVTGTKNEGYGGGFHCSNGGAEYGGSPILVDCTFTNNSASPASGGGVSAWPGVEITLTNCTFTGNTAAFDGGGIYVDDSTATLTGCTFNSNTSTRFGGAMALPVGTADLSNCNFTGNQASYGGAFAQNAPEMTDSDSTFTDCQFVNNMTIDGETGGDGGAVYAAYSGASTTFDNCVFSGNSSEWRGGGVSVHVGADASMLNCEVSNNSADSSPGEYTGGGGIIVAYGGILNLSDTIVCSNTPDQVGGQDGYIDNGGNFVEDICECAGDIIDDGVVDLIDFTAFLVNFGATGENIADLNGDLVVDLNDFSIFLVNYGNVCETRSAVAETGLGKVAPTHHIGGVPRR